MTRPVPVMRADDLLVAVQAVVIAGPELAAIDRADGRAPGGAAVGVVAAAGTAGLELIGRRVALGPLAACGECGFCRAGHLAACPGAVRLGYDVDGALASHVVVSRRWVCPLDGALAGIVPGPEAAALGREAGLAATLVARAGVGPGTAAVWLGGGTVARLGLAISRALGALSLELVGAELDLGGDELRASLRTRVAAEHGAGPPWTIFEASGRQAGRQRLQALAADASTIALLCADAIAARDDEAARLAITGDAALALVGGPHPDLVPETAARVARGELDLAAEVSLHQLDELGSLLTELRTGRRRDKLAVLVLGDTPTID